MDELINKFSLFNRHSICIESVEQAVRGLWYIRSWFWSSIQTASGATCKYIGDLCMVMGEVQGTGWGFYSRNSCTARQYGTCDTLGQQRCYPL